METYVGQQNNNLFCQRIEKKWQFCSIQGFFTELTQLFIKGLKKRKQESTFLTFFFSSFLVRHFINGIFEILEQQAMEKPLKVI